MKKMFTRTLVALGLVTGIMACNAKVTTDDMIPLKPVPKVEPFNHAVQGPSLDGTWKSACERQIDGYVMYELTIKNQQVIRTETKYANNNCSIIDHITIDDGWFRYAINHGRDIYEVEYRLKTGNGPFITGERGNVRREGAKLWIAVRRSGELVIPDIQMNAP